ncbi:glycosyltransferase [Methyloceanibacter sp. wino2]|uniref:glycosyltransferase n=1 Tax=Methyloceanibacter sp. wino2 TaxID=2170729 RepID=UPI00131F18F6|nr:glycosyltransferase [Methyloceanibacter sp. wino2]
MDEAPKLLFVVHAWGGGTIRFAIELAEMISNRATVVWAWGENDKTIHVSSTRPYDSEISFNVAAGLEAPLEHLRAYGFRRANVIQTIGFGKTIGTLLKGLDISYDVTFTDYHYFSDTPHFEDDQGMFVGDEAVAQSQASWRGKVPPLLLGAGRLIAISGDLANRLQGFIPERPVIATRVYEAQKLNRKSVKRPVLARGEAMRVLFLGRPNPVKGVNIVLNVIERIRQAQLPIEVHCLGEIDPDRERQLRAIEQVTVHGAYEHSDLPEIVGKIDPHLAWFPFTQPETHSYALSDAMRMGLPVLATAIGAVPERLYGRPHTWLVPFGASMSENHFNWIEKLYRDRLDCGPSWVDIGHLPTIDRAFFPKRYIEPILPGFWERLSRFIRLRSFHGGESSE